MSWQVVFFGQTSKNTKTSKPKIEQKIIAKDGKWTRDLSHFSLVDCRPLRQLNTSIEVKQFNCFNEMAKHTKPNMGATLLTKKFFL